MMKPIFISFVGIFFGSPTAKIIHLVRLMNICRVKGWFFFSGYFSNRLKAKGIYISPLSVIDKSICFPHPVSIVIGEGVVVGPNVRIYQNVTLGGARIGDWQSGNYPIIGDNTVIFAGAVVIGKVNIGKNCIIGANSVVLSDVPDDAVCVGAPAKVVSVKRIKE